MKTINESKLNPKHGEFLKRTKINEIKTKKIEKN